LKQVIESLTPEHDWLLWFLVVRHSNGKTIFFSVLFEKKQELRKKTRHCLYLPSPPRPVLQTH